MATAHALALTMLEADAASVWRARVMHDSELAKPSPHRSPCKERRKAVATPVRNLSGNGSIQGFAPGGDGVLSCGSAEVFPASLRQDFDVPESPVPAPPPPSVLPPGALGKLIGRRPAIAPALRQLEPQREAVAPPANSPPDGTWGAGVFATAAAGVAGHWGGDPWGAELQTFPLPQLVARSLASEMCDKLFSLAAAAEGCCCDVSDRASATAVTAAPMAAPVARRPRRSVGEITVQPEEKLPRGKTSPFAPVEEGGLEPRVAGEASAGAFTDDTIELYGAVGHSSPEYVWGHPEAGERLPSAAIQAPAAAGDDAKPGSGAASDATPDDAWDEGAALPRVPLTPASASAFHEAKLRGEAAANASAEESWAAAQMAAAFKVPWADASYGREASAAVVDATSEAEAEAWVAAADEAPGHVRRLRARPRRPGTPRPPRVDGKVDCEEEVQPPTPMYAVFFPPPPAHACERVYHEGHFKALMSRGRLPIAPRALALGGYAAPGHGAQAAPPALVPAPATPGPRHRCVSRASRARSRSSSSGYAGSARAASVGNERRTLSSASLIGERSASLMRERGASRRSDVDKDALRRQLSLQRAHNLKV